MTDEKADKSERLPPGGPLRGWVLYDGECRICSGAVRRWAATLARRGFECVPLQTRWVRERLHLSEHELMREMRVLEVSGKVIGGAQALLLLARHFWWALPLVWLARVPGVFPLLDSAYRWAAARRYCVNGTCALPPSPPAAAEDGRTPMIYRLAVLLLPCGAIGLLGRVEPWVFMWIMAGALWLALKLLTFLDARERPFRRSIAYLFAWPGMDAPEFFSRVIPTRPALREPTTVGVNIAAGVLLLYVIGRLAYPHSILLAGWCGMIGVVLVLHFGVFNLLALLWRSFGIPATPIMNAPLRSRNLAEFWGRRWNTGFSIPARRYLMEPIARKFGTGTGVFLVFLISGIVHELVVSLPAKAGYGLPTLYFLLQAAGMLRERRRGANRFFTILCVAAPALFLFHPPFIREVIVPFLKAIGAL